jgi:disulfide bond formation protein DsbB
MNRKTSPSRCGAALALLVALASAGVLGAALWEQQQGNLPCPLCVLQRIGFVAMLVFALGAAAFGAARRAFFALALASALGGFAVAARHVWLFWHPGQTCGLDPLAVTINHWSVTAWLPWLLRADGFCSDVPLLFGVALPMWSAIAFAGCAALLGWALLMRRR